MLLKRFYDPKLAQASYLIGCPATGEALVVDANRDVEAYVRAAADEGLRLTLVTETHIHADFVSGSRELAARTGAQLLLSDEGDAEWKYAFAAGAGARLLKDGDVFRVGNLKFDVLHTPGHTPEHLTFVITDTPATDRPMGALTGDFIFAGDVGRPDLLEQAAQMAGTMEAGARTLFRSLQRFTREMPDYLQLWPGHGAGSACGKALGAVPSTTLGYEKLANWGLTVHDEAEFVATVLAGQPEPPRYFAEMKRLNKSGPAILGGFRRPPVGDVPALADALERGAAVVDTRPAAAFAAGHVPGTLNIPRGKSFSTWAGWLVPYDRDVALVVDVDCPRCIDEVVRDLAMIGLDRVVGAFDGRVVEAWRAEGRPWETVPQMTVAELARALEAGTVAVIDVRGHAEWEGAHIPGVPNIPVGYLTERIAEVPADGPVVIHCEGGARSAIATSVLHRLGRRNAIDLLGGFAAWQRDGHPVAHHAPAPPSGPAAVVATAAGPSTR